MTEWLTATDSADFKYPRFLGIDAGLFESVSSTRFGESPTPGTIPDQAVTFTAAGQTKVNWAELKARLARNNKVNDDDTRK